MKKRIKTLDEFVKENNHYKLNEIKASYTSVISAKEIMMKIEIALKGGLFFEADLYKKVYMKEGGKRPVQAEKFRKKFILTVISKVKDLGESIQFEYNYEYFTVDKKHVTEVSEKEYLESRLEFLFNKLHTNRGSDWNRSADAWAAGVANIKSSDNVDPLIDSGFIVWFADKYKINLKKFMSSRNYTLAYDNLIHFAEMYPYKP